jgi:signal transduction histidine kinase
MRLYLKLYIAFCLTLLFAIAIMVTLLFHMNEMNEKAQWESFLSDRVKSLSELVINNLQNDNWESNRVKAAQLSSERIGRWIGGKVWILDSTETILGSNSKEDIPKIVGNHFIKIENSQFSKSEHSWLAKINLLEEGLIVVISIPKPDRGGPHLILGIVLALLLGFIILFLPLNYLIGKPLTEIKNTALEIAQGNLNRRAKIYSKDELASVAETINLMANQIERALQNSKDVNAHVSHELRSPIARMRVILELLSDESEETNTGILKRKKELTHEIERIDELVGAVLQLSKLNSQEGSYQDTNLNTLLNKILTDRNEYIQDKNIKLTKSIEQNTSAFLDPVWSESIFKNLIDNSLLYGNPKDEIIIELKIIGNIISFSIENGIYENILNTEKLFLPFVRGENEESLQNNEGLGLGLALSRSSAERMGGSLKVWQNLKKIRFTWNHPIT